MKKKVKVIPTWEMKSEDWLKARDVGIGGSDAGTIAGINKYKSPYVLWGEKCGIFERQGAGDSATWGHRLEPVVASAYAEDYNKAVVSWPVILRSEEEGTEFMLANLDFLIVEPSEQFPAGKVTTWRSKEEPEGIIGILEVKTTGIASPGYAAAWSNDSIPESYRLQTVHYGIVTGITKNIVFAALIGGQGLQVRHLEWDDDLAENLIAIESAFWDLVLTATPPEIDGSEATETALAQKYSYHSPGAAYEADAEFMKIWDAYITAKCDAEDAEKRRKELRSRIVSILKDSESASFGGKPILTFRASKDSETFDARRFQLENPELYSSYMKPKPGIRTLREVK